MTKYLQNDWYIGSALCLTGHNKIVDMVNNNSKHFSIVLMHMLAFTQSTIELLVCLTDWLLFYFSGWAFPAGLLFVSDFLHDIDMTQIPMKC